MEKKVRIYYDEQGRKQATMAASERPEDELCDFCSHHAPPYKVYPCKDFIVNYAVDHRSLGEWNACTPCAEFIDAEDRESLAKRCIKILEVESDDEGYLIHLQQLFFKNRIKEEVK